MYSKQTIISTGYDLVGWRKSNLSDYDEVPTDLKTPQTEYYVNELPGVTVDLLQYVALDVNISDYLTTVHKSELIKVIDNFLLRQKEKVNSKELLSNNTLLQTFNDRRLPISKSGRFVGYAITPRESKSINSLIKQVGFMSTSTESFTLYLYSTCQDAAIESNTIAITSANTLQWFDLDWEVGFDLSDGGAGETYLLGYFENDVTGDLFEMDWTGNNTHVAQKVFGHYMGISPCRFSSGTLNGVNIPIPQYLRSSLNCKTSGFNIRFNTKCDITAVLKDNLEMFAPALQYRIATRILSDCLSGLELNNVVNASQLRSRWQTLITEYNGLLNGGITEAGIPVKGLIDRLTIDFSNLDPVCLKNITGEVMNVKW